MEMKLEVVVVPVSDVDRAKAFYGGLGWREDADFATDALHAAGVGVLDHLRRERNDGLTRLASGPAADRVRHGRGPGRAHRPRQLRLVRLVQRPRRQRLLLQEIKERLPGR